MSYYRYFFKCKECGFMFTTLNQANVTLEGDCSACGDGDVDYAPQSAREEFARNLFDELEYMLKGEPHERT